MDPSRFIDGIFLRDTSLQPIQNVSNWQYEAEAHGTVQGVCAAAHPNVHVQGVMHV